MENLILIGTILAVHVFAWFTPGPVFVLIVRNSLVYSRKAGIWTAVGVAIAGFIHITYSITGISVIIARSAIAYNVIKFLGVGYLAYLGIKTMMMKVEPKDIKYGKHREISPFNAAKIGFFTNILSPQASLFFASIIASVMGSGAPSWVTYFLWVAMPLNSFIMASVLSLFFTQRGVRSVYAKYQNIVNKLLGVALFILAIMVAVRKS